MSEGGGCALAKARFAFQQTNEDELSFAKGDIISVSRQEEGGWWEGSLNGKSGWFPSNYVRELKGGGGYLPPPTHPYSPTSYCSSRVQWGWRNSRGPNLQREASDCAALSEA